eukprot:gene10899-3603_t
MFRQKFKVKFKRFGKFNYVTPPFNFGPKITKKDDKEFVDNEDFCRVLKKKSKEKNNLNDFLETMERISSSNSFAKVVIHEKFWTKHEIVALASIFKYHNIEYVILDVLGNIKDSYP